LKIKDIVGCIEEFAPLSLQESWDNAGLLTGNLSSDVDAALIALDITEEVIDDAISHGEKLIIAHHPLIFSGIKKINGNNSIERSLIKAIKNDIAIYAAHTNIDVVKNGVSWKMAQKLGLEDVNALSAGKGLLRKLIVYVPTSHAELVRDALFMAGAGTIGNYGSCSFNSVGKGTFKGNESTNPFVGKVGEMHVEEEVKIETVFPTHLQGKVLKVLFEVHPYEEVAYDVFPLENSNLSDGAGIVGDLEKEIDFFEYLSFVKETLNIKTIRHSANPKSMIKRVAICGGSGSFLISNAKSAGADIYITGDLKYHDFTENFGPMILADVGHWESEQFIPELLSTHISQKFSNFAVLIAQSHRNPVFCY